MLPNKWLSAIKCLECKLHFGGEGSGCHGDNCGRPKGDGISEEVAVGIENKIAKNKDESGHFIVDGKEILSFNGNGRQIVFDKNEYDKATKDIDTKKIIFTHNHPAVINGHGGSFSALDIIAANKLNIGQIRAVDEHYIHTLKMPSEQLPESEMRSIKAFLTKEQNKMAKRIKLESKSKDEFFMKAYSQGQHEVIENFAKKYKDFKYERRER